MIQGRLENLQANSAAEYSVGALTTLASVEKLDLARGWIIKVRK